MPDERVERLRGFLDSAEDAGEPLGRLAVEKGYITQAQLDECLRAQEEARARGQRMLVGQALLQRAYLTPSRLLEVLAQQNRRLRVCVSCGRIYDLAAHPAGVRIRCLQCGEELAPGEDVPAGAHEEHTVGRYRILRELGRGGMGVVYEAEDPSLRRRVAIKVMRGEGADSKAVRRLHREAAIAAQLRHPNIVGIHEVGTLAGTPPVHFIVMDLVKGRSLAEIIAERTSARDNLVRIVEEVARAAAFAHAQGIVHRDIKPANVIVDASGRALLADFGLAHADAFDSRLTASGAVMGTPVYMAPEQIEGRTQDVDRRTDVYALGAMLYEALAGRPPFQSMTMAALAYVVLREDPPRLDGVPRDLEVVCLKALSKERARRYADAGQFADDLSRARRGEPIRARPPSLMYRLKRGLLRRLNWIAAGVVLAAIPATWLAVRHVVQGERRRADESEAYRALRERLKPYEAMLQRLHERSYVSNIDYAADLAEVTRAMPDVEALAGQPEFARFPHACELAGLGWFALGDGARAERALLEARSRGARGGVVPFMLGRIYLMRSIAALVVNDGDTRGSRERRARAWADRARESLAGDAGVSEIDRAVAEACRALAAGDPPEAARLCGTALKRFQRAPGIEEFWMVLAATHRGEARIASASSAIERRPQYAWAHFIRGAERWRRRDPAARADLDQAVKLAPRFAAAWNERGVLRHHEKEREARDDIEEAMRLEPDNPIYVCNRGIVRFDQGDETEGLADFDRALSMKPDLALAYSNRAQARQIQGNLEAALADLNHAIDLDRSHPETFALRGLIRKQRGDRPGAREDFDEAKKLGIDSAQVFMESGRLHIDMRDPDAALPDFDRVVELQPQYLGGYAGRIAARVLQGPRFDRQAMIDDLRKAIPLMAPGEERERYERMLKELQKE